MQFVYELGCSGPDGLDIDPIWFEAQKKAKRACKHCGEIDKSRIPELDSVWVCREQGSLPFHFGLLDIGGIYVSDELLSLIGRERVRRSCYLVSIRDFKGQRYPFTNLIAKRERGCARGPAATTNAVRCRACGRLLYRSDGPMYLLKRYWPKGMIFRVMDMDAYVDADFYQRQIRPRKLRRLPTKKIRLASQPEDGYPADFGALKEAVQKHGRIA